MIVREAAKIDGSDSNSSHREQGDLHGFLSVLRNLRGN